MIPEMRRIFVILCSITACYFTFLMVTKLVHNDAPLKSRFSPNISIMSFSEFLRTSHSHSRTTTSLGNFTIVIPDQLMFDGLHDSIDMKAAITLAAILYNYKHLVAIAGASVILDEVRKPTCSMERRNEWTLEMREDYSIFTDGSKSIHAPSEEGRTITCYPCDLLPDVFLVDLSRVTDLIDPSFVSLEASARIPFFLRSKSRTAYCPTINLFPKPEPKWKNLTCNNLSTIWDSKFLLLPNVSGIYRLLVHRSSDQTLDELWLGCTWAKLAYDSGLPIHCSHWLRQFLFDLVDLIVNEFGQDYRLIYGTLIGALRAKDVVPWTQDVDISMISGARGLYERWKHLGVISGWKYSNVDFNGQAHYPPLRALPSCPVLLTTRPIKAGEILDPGRTGAIDRLLKRAKQKGAVFSGDTWKDSGYVDIYEGGVSWPAPNSEDCNKKGIGHKVVWIEISGRQFKTIANPEAHVRCYFGTDWKKKPKELKDDWDSWI